MEYVLIYRDSMLDIVYLYRKLVILAIDYLVTIYSADNIDHFLGFDLQIKFIWNNNIEWRS